MGKIFLIYNKIIVIDDQIRDEKLQYDTYREAAKMSALSSGEFDKDEYLTGEEILPSNQQQMIGQTKFNYSPLGRAFKEQIKTIEDQREKQVEALKNIKPKVNTYKSDDNDNDSIRKEVYDKILEERINDILEMSKEINYGNLVYDFKGPTPSISFTVSRGPMYIYNQLRNG